MGSISVILLSMAVFLALILALAIDADRNGRWTGVAFTVAIAGGLIIYGSINASSYSGEPLIAVLRTVVDIGRMFGNAGGNNYSAYMQIAGKTFWTSLYYWTIHFFAYYSLVSVVILVLGQSLIRRLRTWLLYINDVELIYGIDDNSIALARTLSGNSHTSIVFVGNGNAYEAEIRRMGGLWYSDSAATGPELSFLKSLHIGKGKCRFRLSAVSADDNGNLVYALKMRECLKQYGVDPLRTELVMFASRAEAGHDLQALHDHYGYGTVRIYNRAELAARLLMKEYPICRSIDFDDKAKAVNDVDILLIGFGCIGQEILRKLVANGQFYGSTFHAAVFDPDVDKRNGFFISRYPGITENYDISFMPYDGRSRELTDYLRKKAGTLTGLMVAVGNEDTGSEITYGLTDVLKASGHKLPVYCVYNDKVICTRIDGTNVESSVFDINILYGDGMDVLARRINHYYCGEDGSSEEQWLDCDYFSRMSCRASADYLSALLERLDMTDPERLNGKTLDNLGKTEHLRWCAFHYTMGYTRMSDEVLKERIRMHEEDQSVRISKDPVSRIHACLIPWDELDALSQTENTVTGKNLDYKQMDRDNVVVTCRLFKDIKDNGGKIPEVRNRTDRRKYILIILLLILILGLVWAAASGRKALKKGSHVPGFKPAPYTDEVTAVSDSVSYEEIRSLLGDGMIRFVPDADYTPPAAYPLSYDDPMLSKTLESMYPATRDQGDLGTCWVHAAVSLAELSMLKQGLVGTDVDYSELQLAYATYHKGASPTMGDTGDSLEYAGKDDPFLDAGGDPKYAALALMKRRGIVDEELIPYGTAGDILKNGLPEGYEGRDAAHLRNVMFLNIRANPSHVKQAIVENGGAGIIYYGDGRGRYYNAGTNAQYTYDLDDSYGDHAVVVIGWDDDFPKDYFFVEPERDGAWLVRNSWQDKTALKEESYFWLSYEDPTIVPEAYVIDMQASDDGFDNQYCYDTQMTVPNIRCDFLNEGANVFCVSGQGGHEEELLRAVTVYAGKMRPDGADYTVSIYKNLTDPSDPGSGVEAGYTGGRLYYDGYYTIDLSEPVTLKRGEYFSVVVKLDGGNIGIEQDCDYNGYLLRAGSHPGESFYKDINYGWQDVHRVINAQNGKYHNLMIGAFTEDM
ncbi:MAG: hypothetical protein K6F34_05425 [Lachnospiraceae bacterium]|nr:hypothetical protein [Lachnospiraceae bacterium]